MVVRLPGIGDLPKGEGKVWERQVLRKIIWFVKVILLARKFGEGHIII